MSGQPTASRRDWRLALGVALGGVIIRLLAATWRFRILNDAGWRARRAAGQPNIFVLWHGEMLPLVYVHRNQGVAILISDHRDGEIIARLAIGLGHATIRGSTSRGGGRALLGIVRALEQGTTVAVTPDGPRGPAKRFAPGVLVAAQRAGVPITGIVVHAARAWRLRSWDRFLIPKPFTRVVVSYMTPEPVRATSARDAEADAPRFEAFMHEAERRAADA